MHRITLPGKNAADKTTALSLLFNCKRQRLAECKRPKEGFRNRPAGHGRDGAAIIAQLQRVPLDQLPFAVRRGGHGIGLVINDGKTAGFVSKKQSTTP